MPIKSCGRGVRRMEFSSMTQSCKKAVARQAIAVDILVYLLNHRIPPARIKPAGRRSGEKPQAHGLEHNEHSLEHTLGKASPILRNLRVFGKVIHGIELISSGAEVISDPSPENISGFVFTTGEVIAVAAGGWEAIVVVSFVDVFMWAVRPSSVNALEQKVDLMSQKLDILIQRNRQYYSTQASWQPEMGPLTYGEYLRSMGEPTFADYLNGLYQP